MRRAWFLLPTIVAGFAPIAAIAAPTWAIDASLIGGDGTRGLFRVPHDYVGAKLDGRANYAVGPGTATFRVALDREFVSADGHARRETEIQEAAYRWSVEQWEFTVGRQRIQWGRADGFNPTDVWTPRAFDRATLYDVEQYRGADTLRVTRSFNETGQLSLLALPHFRPSQYGPGLVADLPVMPTTSTAVESDRPGWALRYETTGRALDYAVTVADTAELTPYFRPDAGFGLEARYGRLRMVGADAAYAADRWVYRAEAAWRRREDHASALAPADTVDAIVGVERELTEGWFANVQLIETRNKRDLPTIDGPYVALGALNRALFHQQREHYSGVSFAINVRPADQRGELNVMHARYSGGERYFRARAEYPIFERFKLGALYERYAGPGGSSFEFLGRNNVAWLSLSMSFGNL